MIKELIKLANHLDSKGHSKEADYLDGIITKISKRNVKTTYINHTYKRHIPILQMAVQGYFWDLANLKKGDVNKVNKKLSDLKKELNDAVKAKALFPEDAKEIKRLLKEPIKDQSKIIPNNENIGTILKKYDGAIKSAPKPTIEEGKKEEGWWDSTTSAISNWFDETFSGLNFF